MPCKLHSSISWQQIDTFLSFSLSLYISITLYNYIYFWCVYYLFDILSCLSVWLLFLLYLYSVFLFTLHLTGSCSMLLFEMELFWPTTSSSNNNVECKPINCSKRPHCRIQTEWKHLLQYYPVKNNRETCQIAEKHTLTSQTEKANSNMLDCGNTYTWLQNILLKLFWKR